MQVQIRFLTKGTSSIRIEEGTTFSQLADIAGLKEKGTLVTLLNGRYAEPGRELKDGDVVSVFPPVAGG